MLKDIYKDITLERKRQDKIWGVQNHKFTDWISIIAEEFGETAQDANKLHWAATKDEFTERILSFREELVQLAAVTVATIECLDRSY